MRLLACSNCSLVQVHPQPSESELGDYYALYCYEDPAPWEIGLATRASLDRLAVELARYRTTGRLLDVGCGAGHILGTMHREGWLAEGTELSSTAAARLREQGFTVHVGPVETIELPKAHYDVVVMSEVIEHLLKPHHALERVAEALRPGGALYLTTPNFDSLSRRVLGTKWRPIEIPEHLFYFSARSLSGLLARAELKPIRAWTDGFDPFALWAGIRHGRSTGHIRQAVARSEALRGRAVSSRLWRTAKLAANLGLRLLSLGDTLKIVALRS